MNKYKIIAAADAAKNLKDWKVLANKMADITIEVLKGIKKMDNGPVKSSVHNMVASGSAMMAGASLAALGVDPKSDAVTKATEEIQARIKKEVRDA